MTLLARAFRLRLEASKERIRRSCAATAVHFKADPYEGFTVTVEWPGGEYSKRFEPSEAALLARAVCRERGNLIREVLDTRMNRR